MLANCVLLLLAVTLGSIRKNISEIHASNIDLSAKDRYVLLSVYYQVLEHDIPSVPTLQQIALYSACKDSLDVSYPCHSMREYLGQLSDGTLELPSLSDSRIFDAVFYIEDRVGGDPFFELPKLGSLFYTMGKITEIYHIRLDLPLTVGLFSRSIAAAKTSHLRDTILTVLAPLGPGAPSFIV